MSIAAALLRTVAKFQKQTGTEVKRISITRSNYIKLCTELERYYMFQKPPMKFNGAELDIWED
jgi:hypothetical protein